MKILKYNGGMTRKRLLWLGLIGLVVAGSIGIYLVYPRLILAAYQRYPNAVPDQLLYLAATPLPTALPAPTVRADSNVAVSDPSEQLSVISDQLEQLQPTVTASPTATLVPTFTPQSQIPSLSETEESNLQSPTPKPTATSTPLPPTATPLPTAVRLENIDIIPQKFNNCGPANLTITLGYHGVEVDQLDVGDVIKPNYDDRNVSPWEIVDYVNKETPMQARYFVGGDVPLLKQLIAAGYPVIIEKGLYPNAWEGWMGHYLTLVGYDDVSQEFISLDTFLGPWDGSGRRDSYETIHEFWQQFNHTFILVYPPQDEAEILAMLPPKFDDPVQMWSQTAIANQELTTAEPDNPYAWFNLGSSLIRLSNLIGDPSLPESAAAAFDQARTIGLPWRMLWYQFEPYEAYLASGRTADVFTLSDAILSTEGGQNVEETYLYRSYAYTALGDETAAAAALATALELNPNLETAVSDQ
ncbi:C39 family peptidase [Candidatus Leptofilum sp.]|uniref:C39 family peptidase n=1 Tax=Candidatus Leptofilum sp. TaxID=3241576 RepID=UPI003B597FBF